MHNRLRLCMAGVQRLRVLHYSVVYTSWSFMITERILGFLKFMEVNNEACLTETS